MLFVILVLFVYVFQLQYELKESKESYSVLKSLYDDAWYDNYQKISKIEDLEFKNMSLKEEIDMYNNVKKYELYDIPLTVSEQIFIQEECKKEVPHLTNSFKRLLKSSLANSALTRPLTLSITIPIMGPKASLPFSLTKPSFCFISSSIINSSSFCEIIDK